MKIEALEAGRGFVLGYPRFLRCVRGAEAPAQVIEIPLLWSGELNQG
jgi:hypothetical protein